MPERGTYANNIEERQYGVPDVVEENIRKQATRVATKARRPDAAEDLEQEARIKAWEEAANGESTPAVSAG